MNARTVRRAAERKARKLARTGSDGMADEPLTATVPDGVSATQGFSSGQEQGRSLGNTLTTPSAARLAANRQNARSSTGPKTDAGKERSKRNAVKTGLTGRTVLLATDDADRYREHVNAWALEYNPAGPRECLLVQSIADSYWRTERIVRLEFALFAQTNAPAIEAKSDSGSEAPQELRNVELETLLHYEKQLRNLHIQEARLNRQRDKDKKELAALQNERLERERKKTADSPATDEAITPTVVPAAKNNARQSGSAALGFDFASGSCTANSAVTPACQISQKEVSSTGTTPAAAA